MNLNVAMKKTTQIAADRAHDETKTVLPAEVARGIYIENPPGAEALKLMHLLIGKAGGRMAEDVRHELRLADIKKIDGMRNHSRATLRNIKQNLFFAFAYNTLGVPVAAGLLYPLTGMLLSPMIAAAAKTIITPSNTAEKYSALWWPGSRRCWPSGLPPPATRTE